MAESKKAKSIDGVSRHNAATPTARPVILSRGPIMSDPTLVQQGNSEDSMPKQDSAMINQSKTIKIMPLDSDEKTDVKAQADANKEENVAPPDSSSQVTSDQDAIQPPAPIQADNELAAKDASLPEDSATKDTAVADSVEEDTPKGTAKTDQPSTQESSSEQTPAEAPAPVAAMTDSALKKQELQKESEAKEHLAKLDKLIASEEYYLPINMREKKLNQRVILIGAIVCVLLAIVWVDVALDAGIINNNFHLPHTHFFVSKT